jgi:hypothetical protein
MTKSRAFSPTVNDFPDRQPIERSSGPNDETSSPKAAGTEPYVRSPTTLNLP